MRFFQTSVCILIVAAMLLNGCDKIAGAAKNITGNVAGVVRDNNGVGQGYLTIQLVGTDGDQETYQMTTEDNGSFFFAEVKSGAYDIKVLPGPDQEPFPINPPNLKLGPGRTLNIDPVIDRSQLEEAK